MGQTVDQIEGQIEQSREDLRSNLDQLGRKVKSAVDWRQRFRARPRAILAIALAAGSSSPMLSADPVVARKAPMARTGPP